jgi:hypothetical protein
VLVGCRTDCIAHYICLLQLLQVASGWPAEQQRQLADQLLQQAAEQVPTSAIVSIVPDEASDPGLEMRDLHQWSKKRPLQPSTLSNTSVAFAGAVDAPARRPLTSAINALGMLPTSSPTHPALHVESMWALQSTVPATS